MSTLTTTSLPGIARDGDGRPLVTAELVVMVDLPRHGQTQSNNVPFRGVGPAAFDVRDEVRIVQGRRFQSRLRRHSHNWSTGFGLLSAARGSEEQAFALGYLAHLGADVVAHNFFLPARLIGR